MTEASEPDIDFEQCVEDALVSLPDDLRIFMSNVAVVVEDEPPAGMPLLGLYQGVPLTRRSSAYSGVLPDKISIYRGPLERHYGATADTLRIAWMSPHLVIPARRLASPWALPTVEVSMGCWPPRAGKSQLRGWSISW